MTGRILSVTAGVLRGTPGRSGCQPGVPKTLVEMAGGGGQAALPRAVGAGEAFGCLARASCEVREHASSPVHGVSALTPWHS